MVLDNYPELVSGISGLTEETTTGVHRLYEREKNFFDGDRNYGYGGLKYDGRWKKLFPKLIKRYKLTKKSKVLDLGCKKGFLLKDLNIQT